MERLANVVAALEAGKLPSQDQISRYIDFVRFEFLAAASLSRTALEEIAEEHDEDTDRDVKNEVGLSKNGVILARCLKSLLEAYKQLGENKNGDNIVQSILWHLSQVSNESKLFNSPYSQSSSTSREFITSIYPDAAISADLSAIQSSLSTLVYGLWSSAVDTGASNVWNDLTVFLRLSLADAIERVEVEVARSKRSLRGTNDKESAFNMKAGLGKAGDQTIEALVREAREEPQGEEYTEEEDDDESSDEDDDFEDARDQFEVGMRIATEALELQVYNAGEQGTEGKENQDAIAKLQTAISALRQASSAVFHAPRTMKNMASQISSDLITSKLVEAYNDLCDRALEDEEYRSALETLFSVAQQWITRSLDILDTHIHHQVKLADFIEDPTPERHISQALDLFTTLLERCCGGASLSNFLEALRSAILDVREDRDLSAWFEEFFVYIRRSLSERGFSRSEEAEAKRRDLDRRVRKMRSDDSAIKKRCLGDMERVKDEITKLGTAFQEDEDLRRIREAHKTFASSGEAKEAASDSLVEQLSWFWTDILKVYLPKVVELMKDIPVPRTEYKDEHVEFVFENLNISTLSFLPAHTSVQNITDLDLETPRDAKSQSTSQLGTTTQIKVQAVEVDLSDLSFWCLEKTSKFVVSGLVGMDIPPKGVDIDILLRLIQNDEERREKGHFHTLERCNVRISKQATLSIKKSNHGILFTLFRGMMVNRLRDAIEKALTAQLQSAVMLADAMAYDVKRQREKLKHDGVDEGTALAMAVGAQFANLRHGAKDVEEEQTKSKIGLSATGTGFVLQSTREGEEGRAFAIGIEPQILDGEKRGPMGVASQKVGEMLSSLKEDVEEEVQDAGESVKSTVRHIKGFGKAVEAGRLEEQQRDGWESEAFNL